MTYKIAKCPPKSKTVLYSGNTDRPYCAFPSILETNKGILCAFKQGTNHAWDEGITTGLLLRKDGTILQKGIIAIPSINTQNAELLRLKDRTVVCWIDRQDNQSSTQRMGSVCYPFRNGTFIPEGGILTDTAGIRYGYVFDSIPWQDQDFMLEMTFPELPSPTPRKTVSLLTSRDGITWEETLRLDSLLNASVNESSLAILNDTLYIFCRGYDRLGYMVALVKNGGKIARRTYGEADGIFNTGRPKLFVRDGKFYAVMRNYGTADNTIMRLDLIRFNPVTLRAEEFCILDESPTDGYYAEPYFDGDEFCLITYKCAEKATPSTVLLRYTWSDLAL